MPLPSLSNSKLYIPFWLAVVLLIVAGIKVAGQIWIADKGLDILDESCYLTLIRFCNNYPSEPHGYYGQMLSKLLPFDPSLVGLRLLGVATETLGISYLTISFYTWAQVQQEDNVKFKLHSFWVLLFVISGAAFTSVFTRAFSYNDFSYLTTSIATGTLLLVFRHRQLPSNGYKAMAILSMAAIGILLGVQAIVKPPTTVLLIAGLSLFVLIYLKENWLFKALVIFVLVCGAFGFLMVYFGGVDGIKKWIGDVVAGILLLQQFLYSPKAVYIDGYLKVDLLENSRYYLVPLLAAVLTYLLLLKRSKLNNAVVALLAYLVGLVIWLVMSATIEQYFLGNFFNRYIAFHWFNVFYFGFPFARRLFMSKKWLWLTIVAMLVVLPLVPLLGSNQPTTLTLTKYLAAWYILIAMALGQRYGDAPRVKWLFMGIITIVGLVNYIHVQWFNAYGINKPVFAQTETVQGLYGMDGIKVDKQSAIFFDSLKVLAQQAGYESGRPILALGDLCGAVTVLEGYMPETFWYFSDENAVTPEEARRFSCLHLSNIRIAEHTTLPLVMISSGIHQTVQDCLVNSEVPYPENYYLVNTIFNPYSQETLAVWAPNSWALPNPAP